MGSCSEKRECLVIGGDGPTGRRLVDFDASSEDCFGLVVLRWSRAVFKAMVGGGYEGVMF